jgi:hypothetical protein
LKNQIPIASHRLSTASPLQITRFLARIQSVVKSGLSVALKILPSPSTPGNWSWLREKI